MSQAGQIIKCNRVDLKAGEVGDNVAIPIPVVDKGKGDPHSILGVIVNHDENYLYTIAVKNGILKSKYSWNEFDLCPHILLTSTDVNQEKHLSGISP